MSMLTEHFSEEELGVAGAPQVIILQAQLLSSNILEPARLRLGPLVVTDGYRNLEHNKLVHGVSESFHLYSSGQAAVDVVPESYNIRSAFDWLRLGSSLPFDKVILELDKKSLVPKCIHIQHYTDDVSKNRRQAFEGFTYGQGDYVEVAVV